MAVQNPPIWLQAGSHSAEQARRATHGLTDGRGGIVTTTDLGVFQNDTPNMSVNIVSGRAFILGTEAGGQGTYFVESRATENRAIAASDPTNPRKDLVVARVKDAAYSGVTNSWDLEVVTGTPAPSPSEPAVPANSLVLAMVDVAALATSITNANITDRRTQQSGQSGQAVALGGITVCLSTNRPPHKAGRAIYETDTNRIYVSDGTNWRLVNPGVDITSLDVATAEATASATYTDLATSGPARSVHLEGGQKALIVVSARIDGPGSLSEGFMSWAVSGTETVVASDSNAAHFVDTTGAGTIGLQLERTRLFTASAAAGTRTFTAKYRTTSGSWTFRDRSIIVEPR